MSISFPGTILGTVLSVFNNTSLLIFQTTLRKALLLLPLYVENTKTKMACSSVVWYLQSMNDALGLISNPAPAHTQRLLVRFLSRLVTGILLCLSYQDEEEEEEGEKEMKRGRIKRKSSRQLLFSFPFNPPCVTSNLKRQVRWAQCVKQKKPHEELIRHLKTS